jgi:aspartate/methionine/tyrosine aminotransferase
MKKLSQFVLNIDESATLAASNRAKELAKQGRDIINLSVGQPDFETPENIQKAAIAAIASGKSSWYTQSSGLPELKTAIAAYWDKFYGYPITAKEILVTAGAKFALYAFFQTVLDPGDEVIVRAPYWVSYVDQIKMAGGRPVIVNTSKETDYKMTVEQLEAVVTDKTKVLLITNPSNPTGVIYTKEELTAIGQWAFAHDLLILADEIYGRLVYNQAKWTPVSSLGMRIREHTMIISGVSKTFSMTGWRIGVAVGDPDIIAAMGKIASQTTSNPTAVSQYAAIEAFGGDQSAAEAMRKEFERRLNTIYPLLAEIPGFEIKKPDGAFYLFPRVLGAMELTGFNYVDEFSDALLEEAGVAVVAGSAFGSPENIRLSYATDLESLIEATNRIKSFIEKHKIRK